MYCKVDGKVLGAESGKKNRDVVESLLEEEEVFNLIQKSTHSPEHYSMEEQETT